MFAHLAYLFDVVWIFWIEGSLFYRESQVNLALAVAQLHLRLRQICRVVELTGSKRVVEPAQRVDSSLGDDSGVAVYDAVVVLDSHIHVASIIVFHVLNVGRVGIANDVVGASLLMLFFCLHHHILSQRVALGIVHVVVVETVLREVVGACVVYHWTHELLLFARHVVDNRLHY